MKTGVEVGVIAFVAVCFLYIVVVASWSVYQGKRDKKLKEQVSQSHVKIVEMPYDWKEHEDD